MNLTLPRSDKSVWDKPGLTATLATYDQERWLTAAWASALTIVGARRGGFGGGLLATAGAVLAVRAAMGRHDLSAARALVSRSMSDRGYAGYLGRREDIVDQSADESFPASDAPAWTGSAGTPEGR